MRALCFFGGFLWPLCLSAQIWGAHLSTIHTQWKDPQLSPMVLSRYSIAGGLSYARHTSNHYQRFQLLYTASALSSSNSSTFTASSNTARHNYGQMNHVELWAIGPSGPLKALAGMMGHLTVSYRQHHYIGGITEDQFEGALGFGPALVAHWQPQGDFDYRILLGAPLWHYAITKRHSPRYFSRDWIWDHRNLYGPARFALLHAEAGTSWAVSEKTSLSLDYQAQLTSVHIAQPQRSLQHRLLLGVHLKWAEL